MASFEILYPADLSVDETVRLHRDLGGDPASAAHGAAWAAWTGWLDQLHRCGPEQAARAERIHGYLAARYPAPVRPAGGSRGPTTRRGPRHLAARSSRRRWVAGAAVAAVAATAAATVGLAACSAGSAGSSSAGSSSADRPTTTLTSDSTAGRSSGLPAPVKVNRSVHYDGYLITLEQATAAPPAADPTQSGASAPTSATVTVTAVFHNSEGDPAVPGDSITDVALSAAGQSYPGQITSKQTPGGAGTPGSIEFDNVSLPFSFAGAQVTFGSNLKQQAAVPLASAGALVDLAPVDIPVAGLATTVDGLTLSLKTADVSAEVPGAHVEVGTDHLVLYVGYSESLDANCANLPSCSGHYDPAESLRLQLPDGSFVPPGVDGTDGAESAGGANLFPAAGTTTDGAFARFTIPAVAGTYHFQVKLPNGAGSGPATDDSPPVAIQVPAFRTVKTAG